MPLRGNMVFVSLHPRPLPRPRCRRWHRRRGRPIHRQPLLRSPCRLWHRGQLLPSRTDKRAQRRGRCSTEVQLKSARSPSGAARCAHRLPRVPAEHFVVCREKRTSRHHNRTPKPRRYGAALMLQVHRGVFKQCFVKRVSVWFALTLRRSTAKRCSNGGAHAQRLCTWVLPLPCSMQAPNVGGAGDAGIPRVA